jgi:hypothetical protein
MAKSNPQLGQPNWRIPEFVPAFVEGNEFAPNLYRVYNEDVAKRFDNNTYLQVMTLVPANGENLAYMSGSNVFANARLDTIARQNGMRVATLADLSNPHVMAMVKDRFYTDTPAFVVQSAEDSRTQNKGLLKQVIGFAEQKAGSVKFPFMVTGFDLVPFPEDAKQGYGLGIVARPDFAVTQDARLSGKNYGKSFNEVDEPGLPKFDKNGKRNFYARNEGLAWLFLGRYLSLNAGSGNLAYSCGSGRVVLISGGATSADFFAHYQANLQKELEARKSELDTWLAESMAKMPGKK